VTINFWSDSIPEGYYDKRLKNGLKNNKGLQTAWHHLTFLAISKNIKPEGMHLDYATGPGTFLGVYIKGNKSTGVDISKTQIEYAKKNYRKNTFFTVEEFKKLNYQNSFDTITVIGLLEFLTDNEVVNLVIYLKSLLKENGVVIFSTPNFKSSMFIFSKILKFLSPINYDDEWTGKRGYKDYYKLLKDNGIDDFTIDKHVNIGILFSFFNLKIGTKISQIISKTFKYRIGWILIIKFSK
jgi:2-polyprenyl-3-methyl-5-hydroxy-6-metoxy-1,4-benzoquinol methylase